MIAAPLCQMFVLPGPLRVRVAETKPSLDLMVPEENVAVATLVQPEINTTPALLLTVAAESPSNLIPNDWACTLPLPALMAMRTVKTIKLLKRHSLSA